MPILWGPKASPTRPSVTGEDLIVWSILLAFGVIFAIIFIAGMFQRIW